ncbi:MAG: hypothetical protein AB7F96_06575 [Beijerinckiaceae bacterium]
MADTKTMQKPDDAKTAQASAPGAAKLPGAEPFEVKGGGKNAQDATAAKPVDLHDHMNSEERERNAVFGSLVTGDEDIVGLVAYSIYKQNKHDWLVSFNKAKDREPNESEAYSYIVGESTPRRLAIYRHLAQATLEGRGPQVSGGPATEKFVQRNLLTANTNRKGSTGGFNKTVLGVVGIAVVLVALYLAAKFGLPGVSR